MVIIDSCNKFSLFKMLPCDRKIYIHLYLLYNLSSAFDWILMFLLMINAAQLLFMHGNEPPYIFPFLN